ncbi:MAG: TraR/DksA family transcriptional regulator [Bryobacteraceae bacterium]
MEYSEQIRERLLARQKELEASLSRQNENALNSGEADVQDEIDRVTTSSAKALSLSVGAREAGSLADVRSALARLDAGEYGRCVVCGKEIEPARLRALPETPYCLEHADKMQKGDEGLANPDVQPLPD